MYTTILLAVDDSAVAQLALTHAARLAGAMKCVVHLVHVVDDGHSRDDAGYLDPEVVDHALLEHGRELLNAARNRLEQQGIRCTHRLIERPFSPANIAITIDQAARDARADLVIMGTHGRRGVKRLLLGSVAEGVLRLSKAPVLLVRGD